MIKDISRKKLYLDVCTLCRPFDDQNIMRIRLETDAFYLILQNIQNKLYEMVVSPVHFKEIETIEELRERLWLLDLLGKYGVRLPCDSSKIRKRAEQLCNLKFGIADAAHVAFAETTSDFFITCDDKLLRKCDKSNVKISVVSPVDFCSKEDLR